MPIQPEKFPRDFFLRPTQQVAQDLLGTILTTRIDGAVTAGRVVEVEAYEQELDEASHSFRGKTKRNYPMFAAGGHCYVYLIYGVHYCVNIVTEKEGVGCAVLIRALEPVEGIDFMMKRRKVRSPSQLTSGPGKLCQAMGIDLRLQGVDLLSSDIISLAPDQSFLLKKVQASARIGISKCLHLPWRYYLENNSFISRKI